jgi:hypothetical protein
MSADDYAPHARNLRSGHNFGLEIGVSWDGYLSDSPAINVTSARPVRWKGTDMLVLGVVLLLIGLLAGIPILWTIGVILAIVGAVLMVMGSTGRQIGGRRHYY